MTTDASLAVVGIGNALVDVISHETDEFIAAHGLVKSAMTLIETDRAEELYAAMGVAIEMSGGSVANTPAGVASFGGRTAYLGRVYDDELGGVFAHDMKAQGVHFANPPVHDGPPTGRSLIVVTPDAHRTMNTYLGASAFFCPDDVDADIIRSAQVTILEGYLFDRPESQDAYWTAAKYAADAGRKVALTLSDLFCVERHRDGFLPLVGGGAPPPPAPPPQPVTVVDTTGAGDLYAAGFLYGFTSGRPLPVCGELGSLAAAEVISHIGARPETSLAALAAEEGLLG